MYNPSLRQEPLDRMAPVIPLEQKSSMLDWLEEEGRLLARSDQDDKYTQEEGDISDIIDVEDVAYDEIDDDDELIDIGEED
jgi:hypothetical protein